VKYLHLVSFVLTLALGGCGRACLSKILAQTHDPAGVTFKVMRTDCDTLAKDSAISVIASRDGRESAGLLLKYDPWADEIPQVHIVQDTVVIHLARASSILVQHLTWETFNIRVEVGELAYPNRP
jgi:hypothetical protein